MKYILLLLSIISILYGVLIFSVGSGTSFWIVWELIGVFFFLWAILVHLEFFVYHKIIKVVFHTIVIVAIFVLTTLCGMISSEFTSNGEQGLDYIVVLGAQVRASGPSVVLKRRLDTAIKYLNENPDTVCIVSGGQGPNEPVSEAEGMAEYLIKNGIEEQRVILEAESKNTVQNIKYSKVLLKDSYHGIGIVTNNFHVFRAVQIAKTQGMEGVQGIAASSNPKYLPNNVLRECLGILKDWLMHNI